MWMLRIKFAPWPQAQKAENCYCKQWNQRTGPHAQMTVETKGLNVENGAGAQHWELWPSIHTQYVVKSVSLNQHEFSPRSTPHTHTHSSRRCKGKGRYGDEWSETHKCVCLKKRGGEWATMSGWWGLCQVGTITSLAPPQHVTGSCYCAWGKAKCTQSMPMGKKINKRGGGVDNPQ